MWKKTNYGGKPTTNKDKKYAIFIGRFQPYHFGHIELIKQKLTEGIPALILVRNIAPDATNPFTTSETIQMIEKYHKTVGDDVKVMSIPDIESVNFGRGVGYEINEFVPPPVVGFISATKIRNCISANDESWKKTVHESIHKDIEVALKHPLMEDLGIRDIR
tara:strand:- start:1148 stop:1633 length:486 start_codon:yes stop_codon:yes gene_type:complete